MIHRTKTFLLLLTLGVATATAAAQDDQHQLRLQVDDKSYGISTRKLDTKDLGVAIYPGAQVRKQDKENDGANLSLDMGREGMKLLAQQYFTPDPVEKVVAFYKHELTRYGEVLECRHGQVVSGREANGLKCEKDDDDSESIELKTRSGDSQHVVGVTPKDKGTEFGLVVLKKTKRGEI